jgi:hypothetical protein
LAAVATSLRSLARHLSRIEQDTGRLIHIDLEPEPGCYLDTASDAVHFFEQHLLPRGQEEMVRRHIRICHDVCHAAVMQEDQAQAIQTYAAAGLRVGKVQISAAVGADLNGLPDDDARATIDELAAFAEQRYLHQTTITPSPRPPMASPRFFEDLPVAIEAAKHDSSLIAGLWRTHFHVPIFLKQIGRLSTTGDQIPAAISAARRLHDTRHFEVETYAWGVLPAELRSDALADGIARELAYARQLARQVTSS